MGADDQSLGGEAYASAAPAAATSTAGRGATSTAIAPPVALPAQKPGLLARTFDSLTLPQYRVFWFGTLLSMGATQMNMMTGSILVYDIQSARIIAGIVGMSFAPTMLLFSLFGGVAVDRFDRRTIIQAAQGVGFVVAVILGLLDLAGFIQWWHLLIAGLTQGAMFAFLAPARQTAIPRLVGKDQLSNGVALNSTAMSLMSVLAPALGGLLYEVATPAGVYFLVAAMYLASVFLTGKLPTMKPKAAARKAVLTDIRIGFGYIARTPIILWLVAQGAITALLSFPFRTLLPVYAKDVYHATPSDVGVLMAVLGVGALVGALFMAVLRRGQRRGLVVLLASLITGFALLFIAGIPYLAVGALGMLVIGLGDSGRMALGQSLVLENADDEYRGRVMSIFMMTWGLMPLGVLPLSAGFDLLGPQMALGVMAVMMVVASAAFFLPKGLRRLG
ncbi:MAG: MFS transporter [Chloroflexi bacterium]|nr:MFS transporter [Chloroflexota bacterium]